jgi:hypothetical protein
VRRALLVGVGIQILQQVDMILPIYFSHGNVLLVLLYVVI